jgi:replication factor C small subunit
MSFQIWTEKYRPDGLDEVVGQKHVVERLKAWVKDKSMANMIFAGPPGSGKTSCSIAMAKELFGKNWHQNFQETNSSDERGIDVVRGRIKEFARSKPIGADFKIIFLDESDNLTSDAQQALRRTMERFSDAARFILSCNYSTRLIEPVASRCAVFRFRRLEPKDVERYLQRIVDGEKLKIDKDATDAIVEISNGDLRKATNLLQVCATRDKITRDVVYEIASQARPKDVAGMLEHAQKGDFPGARKLLYDMLINQGLAAEDIVRSIHTELFNLKIDDKYRLKLVERLGEYEFRLNQGATPEIQLEAFLAGFLEIPKAK